MPANLFGIDALFDTDVAIVVLSNMALGVALIALIVSMIVMSVRDRLRGRQT